MSWEGLENISGPPEGSWRSIRGYADESMAISRALRCGYNLFFKAWRDSPYDAVLDHAGVLFRIEIKGSTTDSLSVTTGGRSGAQIDRNAPSRERVLSKNDCDFVIGVSGRDGTCFIVPAEVIGIFDMNQLSYTKLEKFKEKWGVFKGFEGALGDEFDPAEVADGFSRRTQDELLIICRSAGIHIISSANENLPYPWAGFRNDLTPPLTLHRRLVLDIWSHLYSLA